MNSGNLVNQHAASTASNNNNNLTLGELLSKQRSSVDNSSSIVVIPGGDSGHPEGTPVVYGRRNEQFLEAVDGQERQVHFDNQ